MEVLSQESVTMWHPNSPRSIKITVKSVVTSKLEGSRKFVGFLHVACMNMNHLMEVINKEDKQNFNRALWKRNISYCVCVC